jgi:LysM repeat protein
VPEYDLRVPRGSAAVVIASLPGLPSAPEIAEKRITVKKGETPAKVAARAGVSVAELCDWNDIPRTAKLLKGTVLVVPSRQKGHVKEAAAPKSAVAKGEIRAVPTPASAVTHAADVGLVRSAPGTQADSPPPSRIDIPTEGFADAHLADGAVPAKTVHHKVKKGETLYSLASHYGTTVDAIRRENRLKTASLRAGQTLTLTLVVLN